VGLGPHGAPGGVGRAHQLADQQHRGERDPARRARHPANSEVASAIEPLLSDGQQRVLTFIDDIVPELGETPIAPQPGGGQLSPQLLRYATDMRFGNIGAREAAEGFYDELTAALEARRVSAISELSKLSTRRALSPEDRAARRKEASRDNKAGYLFLLPWLVGLFAFTLGPMLASLYLSMTDYNLIQTPSFIGLDNYARMLDDARLHQSLRVTFTYVVVGVPLQLAFALAIALLLDKGMRGLPIYRSIFYLPSMLGGSVAIALLWRQI